MTQSEWKDIFLGDITAAPSAPSLRRWAGSFADDIKAKCPDYADELRQRYVERLAELQKACKP